MAPQENPHNDENADSLMNDLLSAAKISAKKPESVSPTPTPPAQPRRLSTTDFASIPRTREEEEAEAEAQAQAEANLLQAIPPVVSHDEGAATVPHVAERPTAPAPQEGMVGKILRFFGLNKD